MVRQKEGRSFQLQKKFEFPIHFVGLGEKVEDLFEFNAKKFSHSMLGIEEE